MINFLFNFGFVEPVNDRVFSFGNVYWYDCLTENRLEANEDEVIGLTSFYLRISFQR